MLKNVKNFIFVIAAVCAAFIAVNVNASVYVEDFTHQSQYLTLSLNDPNVSCDIGQGSLTFDFAGVQSGKATSRYAYQKYIAPQSRLFVEFDYELFANASVSFELRNYDSNLEGSGIKGSYIPFSTNGTFITFADGSKLTYGQSGGTIAFDITADSQNTATIKIYIDNYLYRTDTVSNFPLKAQSSFEYRLYARATGTSDEDAPKVKIDNLKVVIDESQNPTIYVGEPEYYFDFGDNRFLKSENVFTFNRVKSVRRLANFTNKTQSLEAVMAQYGGKASATELSAVTKNSLTLKPGEVVLAELADKAPASVASEAVASMLWKAYEPIAPKSTAKQSTARVPLPAELAEILSDAQGVHPRLLTTAADITQAKDLIQSDAAFGAMYASLIDWKNTHNSSHFLTCNVPSYGNAANVADIIYNRATVWGYLYQLSGDDTYAQMLVRDMLTIASYDDWYYGKENFLITAHIASAVAIGYDFTYDYLCREENLEAKYIIENAIHKNAVLPALEIYREDTSNGWQRRTDNWNMICNGGIATACMAIGDIAQYSEACSIALNYAMRLIENSFGYFAPEGAWVEGMGYYGYMMNFGSDFVTALSNTFGSSFGYTDFDGFAASAADFLKLSGSRYIYNYSDADSKVGNNSSIFSFFGKYFGRNELGYARRYKFANQYELVQNSEALPSSLTGLYNVKDLIWYSPAFANTPANAGKAGYDDVFGIENDTCYTGTGIVALHSDFSDTQAFAAANCGKNADYHTHVDMGSFVYESDGEQWFVDLGLNPYSIADCFNKQYYRLKPEGHNCVVFNPSQASIGQVREAEGSIVAKSFGDDESWFVMDITSAYADDVENYKRLIYLDKLTKSFAVKDKFSLKGDNNEFYWFAHTPADITLSDDGKTATLTKSNGKTLQIVLDGDGSFEIMAAERLFDVPDGLNLDADPENTGITKLAIHREGAGGEVEITVKAAPNGATMPDISKIDF